MTKNNEDHFVRGKEGGRTSEVLSCISSLHF